MSGDNSEVYSTQVHNHTVREVDPEVDSTRVHYKTVWGPAAVTEQISRLTVGPAKATEQIRRLPRRQRRQPSRSRGWPRGKLRRRRRGRGRDGRQRYEREWRSWGGLTGFCGRAGLTGGSWGLACEWCIGCGLVGGRGRAGRRRPSHAVCGRAGCARHGQRPSGGLVGTGCSLAGVGRSLVGSGQSFAVAGLAVASPDDLLTSGCGEALLGEAGPDESGPDEASTSGGSFPESFNHSLHSDSTFWIISFLTVTGSFMISAYCHGWAAGVFVVWTQEQTWKDKT